MKKLKNKKSKKKSKKLNKLKLISVILVLLIVCAAAVFLYDYTREKEYILTTVVDGEIVNVTVSTSKGRLISSIADPVLEGHTFEGWFLDEAFTQPLIINKTKIKGVSNIYANMMIIKYTQKFLSNGGSDVASISYEYGTSPIEPDTPVLYNNLFTGWYLDEDKTERYAFNTIPNADITLYAGWVTVQSALTYFQSGSTISITGFKADIPEYFIMPTTIDGYNVSTIATEAFKNCTKLIEVSIPSDSLVVGTKTFTGCTNLVKMSIPLRDINFYPLAHYFGGASNVPVSLHTVIVNDGCLKLAQGSFTNCSTLVTINIPDSVTIIDEGAFINCSNLVNINMPPNLIKIGASAFADCHKLKSIAIPEGVNYIGVGTFSNCVQLTHVSLPETITRIEQVAFYGCTSLEHINLPNSINMIGIHAFFNCKLTNVTIPTSLTQISNGLFYNCTALESVVLHDGVTSIGEAAFLGANHLISINLPESITSIGDYAFAGCSRLNNLIMPSGLLEIGISLFEGCTMLSNITLPENLQIIKARAFISCSSLRNIDIPHTLTHLGDNSFAYCTILDNITFNSTTPPVMGSSAFDSIINPFVIKVPSGSVSAYKAASGWSTYSNKIEAI